MVVVIESFQASFPGGLINENQQVKIYICLLVKDCSSAFWYFLKSCYFMAV